MRLRRRCDFLTVQRHGVPFHTRHFVVVALASRPGKSPDDDSPGGGDASGAPISSTPTSNSPFHGRLGITVTKKVGNAVIRNRIKRLVREASRRHAWIPSSCDVVVIAKKHAAKIKGLDAVVDELTLVRQALSQRFPC